MNDMQALYVTVGVVMTAWEIVAYRCAHIALVSRTIGAKA